MPELRSLHFTDCRAGEGLLGGAGLQFRAVSTGVDGEDMQVVQRHCLYEPPDDWMLAQRQVGDYPPSLAHIFDGRFATARGVYLGTEAKGSRRGNHFTHALVTTDPDGYGQVRPAQLWASPVWVTSSTGDTTCPPVAAEPPPGPLEALELQRWVAGQPDGEAWLVALLSALHGVRAGGPRLLFLASDPESVLAWLAAATLLLPRADALRVGFKVYVTNPAYSAHDVVAVHPDWGAAFRGAPAGAGFVVFDLDSQKRSDVAPTPAALFWVPRFLRRDCFDVLDAVELGGTLDDAGFEGVERLVAARLVLGEPLDPAVLDRVVDWVRATGRSLDERLLAQVFPLLLAEPLDPAHLDALRQVAAEVPGRERLGMQVLGRALTGVTGRTFGEPSDAAAAERAVELAVAGAGPERVANLLTLAARHGLRPDPSRFVDALRAFARWWADTAADVPEMDRWSCRDEVIDLLRDELTGRVTGSLPQLWGAEDVDRWWPRLYPTIRDPRSALDSALCAAALRGGDAEVRRWVRQTVLTALHGSGGEDALDVAWEALHRDRAPDLDELPGVLALAVPARGLPPRIAATVEAVLAAHLRPEPDVLRVLDLLSALGHRPHDPRLRMWTDHGERVLAVAAQVAGWPATIDGVEQIVIGGTAAEIGTVPEEILDARVGPLVAALGGPHPTVAAALVRTIPDLQRDVLVAGLGSALITGVDERIAAAAFLVCTGLDRPPEELRRRLGEYRVRASAGDNTRVADLLDEDQRKQWWAQKPERRLRDLFRRGSR